MPDEIFPRAELHVRPESIPALRAAIQQTLDELSPDLRYLAQVGNLTTPWLYEQVSIDMMEHYNEKVMRSDTGLYRGLLEYQKQLKAAVDALDVAEKRYQQNEQDQTDTIVTLT